MMDLVSLRQDDLAIGEAAGESEWHVLVAGAGWSGCAILRPDPRQSAAFLFTGGGLARHHSVADLAWGGPAIPARIVPAGDGGGFRLVCCRFEGVFAADDVHHLVLLAGHETGTVFGFGEALAVDAGTMRPMGRAIAALLRQARAGLWWQQTTLSVLAGADGTVVRAVLAALTEAEFDRMADSAMGCPELARLIGSRLGDDAWLVATVGLARWNESRDDRGGLRRIGRELDFLGMRGVSGIPMNESAALHFACRRRVMPRKRCGLVATASNEGPYLLDWIAYHRSIGIEQVVIYSNGNVDGSDGLLAALAMAGAIIWIDNDAGPGVTAQFKAYGHALGMLPEVLDCEWTLVLDLDEYFGFDVRRFGSINDYLSWQSANAVDAVLLNWIVFGPHEEEAPFVAPGFLGRYLHRVPGVDKHVKPIFRSRLFNNATAHVPLCEPCTGPVGRTASGDFLRHELGGGFQPYNPNGRDDAAWINHYLLRSPQDMAVKWMRNRGDEPVTDRQRAELHLNPDTVQLFMHYCAEELLKRDTRILACAGRMAAERAKLIALDGVARACSVIDALHSQRRDLGMKLLLEPPEPLNRGSLATRLADCVRRFRSGGQSRDQATSRTGADR